MAFKKHDDGTVTVDGHTDGAPDHQAMHDKVVHAPHHTPKRTAPPEEEEAEGEE
jgi:hypothetical protein